MLRTNARANVLGGEVRVVREVIESSLLVPWIGVPAWLPPTGWGPTYVLSNCAETTCSIAIAVILMRAVARYRIRYSSAPVAH